MSVDFDYKPFLKKAYIDPVRTVTVIDDEYPTLDDLITKTKDDFKTDDIDRLREIVKVSRTSEFNWLLDVYNGQEDKIEEKIVSNRLHHSDLLILDYHLDGEDNGYCKKSIDIIKGLSTNRHFNIVAVHTKGYSGDKGSVKDVLVDIIVSLQIRPKVSILNEPLLKKIDDHIDDWELEDDSIRSRIVESISTLDLLHLIKDYGDDIARPTFEHELFIELDSIYGELPSDIKLNKALFVKWLCHQKLKKYDGFFSSSPASYLDWGEGQSANWLKTEDLFLTVLGKKQTPVNEIPSQIVAAMDMWRPHPHKLILSKLRNEVESKGISASSSILHKKFLQASWLKELLGREHDSYAVQTAAWSTISKLWESLAYEIKPELGSFTVDLVNAVKAIPDPLNYFLEKTTRENEIEQVKHANCFSCSRKVATHHLVTGHVLEINTNYWLCLTPACDLVPGQKKQSDGLMPVTLVQMYDAKQALNSTRESMCKSLGLKVSDLEVLNESQQLEKIIEYSTENNLLFIQPNDRSDDIKILSFTVGLDGKANPKCREYHAENQGIFDVDKLEVNLHYVKPCDKDNALKPEQVSARVVAELRYEYALNLLGKLGVARSRVGLGFVGR
ncbi:response regulator receiver domain [Veronia pacifica]|uniref:Response receiver domain-containing protein n=1 Tax=Veronia pacifica TaxID=1080227 RepID=A0A1C3EK79_9GAMM|nr:response regulator receiver domain [Veronia pacifica]ODA33638.1 hypothetical protein A8L45_09680 [Veronia pacifica]